ncbi:MAG: DUF2096 domain-containing protein [Nitrososphaerota archaeon]|jgi:hypothetical protein|nr:DUF2096 domain-containing protein [Nitrososphaerota archaeon]
MDHMVIWKTLETLLIELRKTNIQIPVNILEDLRTARSILEISYSEDASEETTAKAEVYLTNVKAYIIDQAQKTFDPPVVNEWLTRLKHDTIPTIKEKPAETPKDKFVIDTPRNQHWIRIETDHNKLPEEHVLKLAKKWNLTVNKQTDNRLILYGQLDDIKAFVKQIATKTA